VDDGTKHLTAAVRALEEHGVTVDDIALRRPTLDEVFLALTGQGLDEDSLRHERGDGRAA
jgi:ABC-2 type transport system ATP-binding protein